MSWLVWVLLGALGLVGWTAWRNQQVDHRFPASGFTTEIGGNSVHYLSHTPDEPAANLVLIHGAASNGRELPAALGDRLAPYRWLAPDRPGLGHTARVPDADQLSVQAAMIAGLIQTQQSQPAILVGHSWGSAVSLRVALDFPDLVQGLVLLAPASHSWGGSTNVTNRLANTPVIGFVLSWMLPQLLGPALALSGIAKGFAPGPVNPADYGDRIGTPLYFRPHSFRANAADMVAADRELGAQAPKYPMLKMPVTVISGQGDRIVANSIHAAGLVRDIAHADTHRVLNGGHMPHWVDPDLVINAVDRIVTDTSNKPDVKPVPTSTKTH